MNRASVLFASSFSWVLVRGLYGPRCPLVPSRVLPHERERSGPLRGATARRRACGRRSGSAASSVVPLPEGGVGAHGILPRRCAHVEQAGPEHSSQQQHAHPGGGARQRRAARRVQQRAGRPPAVAAERGAVRGRRPELALGARLGDQDRRDQSGANAALVQVRGPESSECAPPALGRLQCLTRKSDLVCAPARCNANAGKLVRVKGVVVLRKAGDRFYGGFGTIQ